MRISRRNFIKAASVAGAAGAAGLLTSKYVFGWGEITNTGVLGTIPTGGFKVLEVFLYGGVSPWETFYVRSGISNPYFGLDSEIDDLDWSGSCTGVPSPSGELTTFANDSLGTVAWGPSTKPLWRATSSVVRAWSCCSTTSSLMKRRFRIPSRVMCWGDQTSPVWVRP